MNLNRSVGLVSTFLAFGVLALLTSCGAETSIGSSSAGEIIYFEGAVSLNGEQVEIGDQAIDGDVLLTGEDAYAEIEFGSYRVLRAEENTRLVLDASNDTLDLNTGALAVVQSKARFLSRDKPWVVRTPTTVAAVRGTVYYAKVESADSTYFCLCNGKIHLLDADDGRELELEASHHNAVRFIRGDDGIVYEEAPMIYHDDQTMESLADLVHVPIDWTEIP